MRDERRGGQRWAASLPTRSAHPTARHQELLLLHLSEHGKEYLHLSST